MNKSEKEWFRAELASLVEKCNNHRTFPGLFELPEVSEPSEVQQQADDSFRSLESSGKIRSNAVRECKFELILGSTCRMPASIKELRCGKVHKAMMTQFLHHLLVSKPRQEFLYDEGIMQGEKVREPFYSSHEQEAAGASLHDDIFGKRGFKFKEISAGSLIDRLLLDPGNIKGYPIQNKTTLVPRAGWGTVQSGFREDDIAVTGKYSGFLNLSTLLKQPSLDEYKDLKATVQDENRTVRMDGICIVLHDWTRVGSGAFKSVIPRDAETRREVYGDSCLEIGDDADFEWRLDKFIGYMLDFIKRTSILQVPFIYCLTRVDLDSNLKEELWQIRRFIVLIERFGTCDVSGTKNEGGKTDLLYKKSSGDLVGLQFKSAEKRNKREQYIVFAREGFEERHVKDTPWFIIWGKEHLWLIPSAVIVRDFGHTPVVRFLPGKPTRGGQKDYTQYKLHLKKDGEKIFDLINAEPEITATKYKEYTKSTAEKKRRRE